MMINFNCSKELFLLSKDIVIFYEYRDTAINNAKDLSDNKIDDKKNLPNFIFLKISL